MRQGGFHLDAESAGGDRFNLQGDVYRGDYDQQLSVPTLTPTNYKETLHDSAKGTGWNLLGRWDRALSVSSDLTLQLYYDHFEREEQIFVWQEYDTFDIDFQHRSRFADRHNLIWGLGYRAIQTHTQATARGSADFDSLTTELWSGFVQDEIELIEDQVQLTLGSKFEHNELTGFEYQPNIRLLWQLQEDKVLWAAVSRAVRTPSLGEIHSILYNETLPPMTPPLYAPLPILIVSRGHPDYLSEELLAYELGFRVDPQPSLSLDLALFLNEYDNLRTLESALPRLADDGPYLILDTTFMNKAQGSVYGLELSADWLIREGWRLALAYSLSEADLETEAGSVDTTNAIFEKSLPRHQLSLRSLSNLRPDLDFDVWIRYVDESIMTRYDSSYSLNSIDGYWDLDLRLAWRPSNRVELSLVGQNLLQGSRLEGMQELYTVIQTEVQRGVYGMLKIDF